MLYQEDMPFTKWPSKAKDVKLTDDLYVATDTIVPKGTTIKVKTTINHGVIVLPAGCKDIQGRTIRKRIYLY